MSQPLGEARARMTTVVKTARTFAKDIRERALSTFWQGAIAVLAVAPPTTDWSVLKNVLVAGAAGGIGAVLSMIKGLMVRNRGVVDSASSAKSV